LLFFLLSKKKSGSLSHVDMASPAPFLFHLPLSFLFVVAKELPGVYCIDSGGRRAEAVAGTRRKGLGA
jgi:hypothetical protein